MSDPFDDVGAAAICTFHDARVAQAGWGARDAPSFTSGAWQWIEANHRYNNLAQRYLRNPRSVA